MAVRNGPVVSLPTVVCRAVEKQNLSRLTGAVALDMESAAIGQVAQSQGVPFAVVRTVSDVAGEDLPLDFNAFLKPWGWMRGIGAMISDPSSLMRSQSAQTTKPAGSRTAHGPLRRLRRQGFGLSPISHTGRA